MLTTENVKIYVASLASLIVCGQCSTYKIEFQQRTRGEIIESIKKAYSISPGKFLILMENIKLYKKCMVNGKHVFPTVLALVTETEGHSSEIVITKKR